MTESAVSFVRCNKDTFLHMSEHNDDTIYFIKDTKQLYIGDTEYIPENAVSKEYVDDSLLKWEPISTNPENIDEEDI
jgi:hypothetical protein